VRFSSCIRRPPREVESEATPSDVSSSYSSCRRLQSEMEVEATQSTYLSPIEQLPLEIQWTIFELAIESLFNLRLTSRTLRRQVDRFATQSAIECSRLTFACDLPFTKHSRQQRGVARRSQERNSLKIHVPEHLAKVAVLRFILFMPTRKRPFEIRRFKDKEQSDQQMQCFKWVLRNHKDHQEKDNFLKMCFGERIEQISINSGDSHTNYLFKEASVLLETFKFDRLEAKSIYLDDKRAYSLF
ncbi:hypothetical protein PMAYCL1PPCAC_27340, partial [Pristionchus mayeri]